jgi:hypothetical protein
MNGEKWNQKLGKNIAQKPSKHQGNTIKIFRLDIAIIVEKQRKSTLIKRIDNHANHL